MQLRCVKEETDVLKPMISVVLSACNEKEHISEAISSIINQTFTDWELILINEYESDDGTYDIAKQFEEKDTRIRVIQNEKRLGLPASLNLGIRQARGKYIARMDADDCCVEDRFEKQYLYMEKNPCIDVLGTNYISVIGDRRQKPTNFCLSNDEIKANLIFVNYICHPSVFMRKSTIEQYNLYYDEGLKAAEDYELWLRALPYVSFANIPEKLLLYRQEENNKSRNNLYMFAYDNIVWKCAKNAICTIFRSEIENYDEWVFVSDMGSLSQRIRKTSMANILAQKFQLLCDLENRNSEINIVEQAVFSRTLKKTWNNFLLKVHVNEAIGKKYNVFIPQLDEDDSRNITVEFGKKVETWKLEDEDAVSFVIRQNRGIVDLIPEKSRVILWGGGKRFLDFCQYEIEQNRTNFIQVLGFSDSAHERIDNLKSTINKIYPDDVKKMDFDFIIITSEKFFNEIQEDLVNKYGIDEEKILPLSCLYSMIDKYYPHCGE